MIELRSAGRNFAAKISAQQNTGLTEKMLQRQTSLRILNTIISELNKIADSEHETEEQERKAWQRLKDFQGYCLGVGLMLSVLISLALARQFYSSVISRLGTISNNATRLASGEILLKPLDSQDEIGRVDASFHSMADRLQELSRLKAEFVSMISHDVRTPLSSQKFFQSHGVVATTETPKYARCVCQ